MVHVVVRSLAVLLLLVLTAPLGWRTLTGDQFMQLDSGSMEPLYEVGDVIIVQEPDGDELTRLGEVVVVAFADSSEDSRYVHRVDEVLGDGAWLRGDNNAERDPQPVVQDQVLGTPRLALDGVLAEAFSISLTPGGRVAIVAAALVLLVVRVPARSRDRADEPSAV